ncbi:hypothetical protein G6F62_005120 [Rhizopus arrhizus]|uniref:Mediator of RNA polymerase II transcription subunit 13 n=1 Tax=Rhizopus oryzae TaxID=64495 RepID=A0A9P6XF74_RHIOR|nr:hypothetical protein G6F23_000535 [Rhizopus arrhizus]KAG0766337.1 hypothetical protein G6F24_003691 [Rhizopus arrhizus]KAG0793204.1 hypothetical protein G6F21_003791 [Rhizopus arrhizus]KAG0798157.1 hypothetical protein G6F22_004499 [Rhizopus arrhizus]KAG0820280.1 hypothetical protein G6F20_000068 [Rhizopus arrhizus]
MLTDSSLTNILIVSGVSQIRYRVYHQYYSKTLLTESLKKTPEHDRSKNILLKAYFELLAISIPVTWRIAHENEENLDNQILLELWVFWFDDGHTGKVDSNESLHELDEAKVGSFTWENAYSKLQSPTASPLSSGVQADTAAPVKVSTEYKMFIRSLRNLVDAQMKNQGAVPLGEFYIFPSNDKFNDVMRDDSIDSHMLTSLLCCSYNVYLASTNLIFQPNTRPIISPSGEFVTVVSNTYNLPRQTEEIILKKWSSLLDIPYTSLIQHDLLKPLSLQEQKLEQPHNVNKRSPSLIVLKNMNDGTIFYYPIALVFVSSSSKMSPTDMAGTNGLFKFNQGISENLGDKWNRSSWNEKVANYWEFVCPKDSVVSSVLDMLSQESTTSVNQAGFLQKAIHESTANASPLMVTTPMATPASTTGNQQRTDSSVSSTPITHQEEGEDKSKLRNQQNLSLAEFAMANFALSDSNNGDMPEYPQQYANDYSNGSIVMDSGSSIQQPQQQQMHLSPQVESIKLENLPMAMHNNGLLPVAGHASNSSAYHSPQMANLGLDAFNLGDSIGVNDMILDIPDRWNDDTMGGLDNFDLGVTEEDFDFFKSEPVTAPAIMSVKNEMFIDSNATADSLMLIDTDIKQDESNIDNSFNMLDKDKLLVLDDKSAVMMDTDIESTTARIHDLSVTPLGVGMAQQENIEFQQDQPVDPNLLHKQLLFHQQQQVDQDNQSFQRDKPKQRELFIPPTFAPVKINYLVNDSKYFNGGKFTYPSIDQDSNVESRLQKSNYYRPDYIPISRSKRLRKRKALKPAKALKEDKDVTESNGTAEGQFVQKVESTTKLDSSHSSKHGSVVNSNMTGNSSSVTNCSSSSSSGSSSDYDSSSCYESDYSDDDDMTNKPGRVLDHVSSAQDSYIDKLIFASPFQSNPKLSVDKAMFEYDSPFADAVADTYKYLCQQVVLGGYPFSGGFESVSSNGIEANEGESTKAVIARRRNLLQTFYGDQPLLPASVTVKGPLNVQQYYDLSETNQAHSKYGKYQVKRRRPAEPNLDILRPPNIVVNRQEELIEGTTKFIMFWEKLRLEPYSCKKHINYFIIYPENDSTERSISQFFKNLGTLYETCQLGSHQPGNIGSYRKGLVPVRLLSLAQDESLEDQQMRSYLTECQNLGSALGSVPGENVYNVIYMLNPSSDLQSNVHLTRCFSKLVEAYDTAVLNSGTRMSNAKPIMQLIPVEHVLRSSSFGGCLKFGLKEIAFSVYSKCHAVVTRCRNNGNHESSVSTAEIYAPLFVLPKSVPNSVQYSLKKALCPFPSILENHAVLHMGYCFSFDKRWMIIVWTDNNGELIEFATLDSQSQYRNMSQLFEEAWRRTKIISKRTGFIWTFVIAKIGLLFREELKIWINCIGQDEKAAIVCLDLESPLNILPIPSAPMTESMASSSMMDSIGTNVPSMVNSTSNIGGIGAGFNSKKSSFPTDENGVGQTKALLLNHRVAYSSKRERASLAILSMDPSSNTENWMIPLASGYTIYTPLPTENSRHGLFNSNPPVIEFLIKQAIQHTVH